MTASVFDTLAQIRIVPVVTIDDAASAPDLFSALAAGGLACAEITLRTDAGLAAVRAAAERDDILVGAGTILTAGDVDRSVDAGASFLVSPGYDDDVVERAQERGIPILPGIATATELQRALRSGLDTVKVFPVEQLGGTALLRSLAAPFPDVRFFPSGGIRPDNVVEYLRLSAVLAVGGSWMVPRDAIAQRDVARIQELAAQSVAILDAPKESSL